MIEPISITRVRMALAKGQNLFRGRTIQQLVDELDRLQKLNNTLTDQLADCIVEGALRDQKEGKK